jgi:PGF-CTERM protein
MRKSSVLIVVLVATFASLTGSAAAQGLDPVSVNAESQATAGDNVTVETVEMDQDGWVGVYEEDVGEEPDLGALVGSAEVDEGINTDIEVETDLQDGGFYYAVPHYEEPSPGELNEPVEVNGTDVQDFFFVAVGTRDVYRSYAGAKQQRRSFQNTLEDLRERVDELERRNERSNNESIQGEIDRLNGEIDSIEQDIQELDETIAETETLLQQLEEAEQQVEEAEGENETDGGEGADNGTDDETGEEATDGGSEGLPGFTAVAALVAALTVALLAKRNE